MLVHAELDHYHVKIERRQRTLILIESLGVSLSLSCFIEETGEEEHPPTTNNVSLHNPFSSKPSLHEMGNCLLGGLGPENDHHHGGGIAKVVTSNGAVMEFQTPVTVGPITDQFPGHGIFRGLFWKSLSSQEELEPGESYFLLPTNTLTTVAKCGQVMREKHVRSRSIPDSSRAPPYRLSLDCRSSLKRSYTEVFGRSGVWKVKLVITPEELVEILSEESRTQELVESMSAVAKCSGVVTNGSSVSDQCSRSSSRNASARGDSLILEI